jgi:hypothetical protein
MQSRMISPDRLLERAGNRRSRLKRNKALARVPPWNQNFH